METNDQDDLPSMLSSGQIPTSVFSEGVCSRMDAPMQYYYDHRCGDPHVHRHRSPGQHEPDTATVLMCGRYRVYITEHCCGTSALQC